jgi:hypothetical protein
MASDVGNPRYAPLHVGLAPVELPLRPLCPVCGAERLSLTATVRMTFEVVAADLVDDLQVLHQWLDGCDWVDDDVAECRQCGWRGRVIALRVAASRPVSVPERRFVAEQPVTVELDG